MTIVERTPLGSAPMSQLIDAYMEALRELEEAGKGGTIRRVTRYMNEKHYRVVELGKPTEDQRSPNGISSGTRPSCRPSTTRAATPTSTSNPTAWSC